MSLVPYSSRDSREIVLRHNDALVIRDPHSKQLILRGTSTASNFDECPYCHQSLHHSRSPERGREPRRPSPQDSFVSPEYFRMLHLAADSSDDDTQNPPSSPIRRLTQPIIPTNVGESGAEGVIGAEFVTSTPAEPGILEGQGIKKEALSPNYFKRFFTEEKVLGKGGKGVVLLVKHELDGVFLGHFACKRVPVGDDHAWLEKVLIEVQLLQRLSHPNLVSYRHVWLEDVKLSRFGPSVPCAFILQEYCNAGDLLHYVIGSGTDTMSNNERLKEQMRRRSKGQMEAPYGLRSSQRKLAFDEIYSFFKDITSGLAHLHAANYIHRDLKPSNCLLHRTDTDFRCLISDFGEVQAENLMRKSTGSTGTISYCAPEVLRMILYFMCFGRLPYTSTENIQEEFEDLDQLRAEISTWSGFHDERKERPDLPDQLYEFLKRLLAIDPADRPTADEILTAIKTGTNLKSPPRSSRSAANGLLGIGKRIQPIDSPGPGTPVGNKRVTRASAALSEARSTSSEEPEPTSVETPAINILPKESVDEMLDHRRKSQSPRTPLLMAPRTTSMSNIQNRIAVYRHEASSWLMRNQFMLTLALRLFIFVVKMYALTKPCLPMATNPLFGYPLLLLAALDLGLGVQSEWRPTLVLSIVHFLVVVYAGRMGTLCAPAAGAREIWEWEGLDSNSSID